MAATPPARQGLKALILRGWNEVPDIVGGSVLALIGLGFIGVGLTNYYRKDGENKRYKFTYVVFRDDDPRAQKVRKD